MKHTHSMWRSVLACILAFCLMFGATGPVLAETVSGTGEKTTLNYVSLGDSMTNGYGLPGYEYEYHKGDDSLTECTDPECTQEHVVFHWSNGYLQEAPASYPVQVAKYFGWNLTQMGMSAQRVEDLHWLLEADPNMDYTSFESGSSYGSYKDKNPDGTWEDYLKQTGAFPAEAWNAAFSSGDYFTWNEFTSGRLNRVYPGSNTAKVVKEYQDAVAGADVISIGIGNGNFGVFMLGRIMEAIRFDGTPDEAMIYQLEDAIRDCDPELQAEILALRETVYTELDAKLATVGMSLQDEMMEALLNTVVYVTVSYALNYAGTLDAIMELNPKAEIILVGIMNTLAGMDLTYTDANGNVQTQPMADVLGVIVEPVNAYIAALPTILQATDNEAYADATFYYAEAPEVECMVDTYEEALEAGSATVRDRFITEIVGDGWSSFETDSGKEDKPETEDDESVMDVPVPNGMVFKMVGPMFYGMVKDYGLSLTLIDRTAVAEYESVAAEWKKYVAGNATEEPTTTLTDSEILSCAVYLAFEQAVIKASHDSTITLDSFVTLATDLGSVFGGVASALIGENGLDMDTIANAVKAEVMKVAIAGADVYRNKLPEANQQQFDSIASQASSYGNLAKIVAHYAMEKQTDDINEDVVVGWAMGKYGDTVSKYASRYVSAGITTPLANALTSDSTLMGLLHLFGRMLIGDGLGAHPSAGGHDELTDAIIYAYENKVTAQDQTIANLKKAAEVLADLVAEYYDEAYAYAYAEAKNAGYIDTAKAAIGAAIAELKALDLSEVPMTDAFKAEVAGEVEEIVEALTAAQNLLDEADALDQAALDALIATLDEAGEAVENLKNLLAQAGVDVTELVVVPALEAAIEKIETEVIPAAEKAVKEIAAAAYDYLIEKLAEAYDYLTDAAVEAAKKYGPAAAEWVYNYLLNNPDAVIAFVNENGPAVAEFLGEYAEELLAVLGFLAYSYGDEAVDYVLNNYEDVLATMSYLVAAYGDEAWALIEVYAEALGITDAINEKLDNIEQIVNEQLAQLNSKLDALEKELAAKKAQLENAAGALKEEINAAIAEIEAAIAEVKAVMAELKEILEAAEDVAGSVEELIGVITGKVEGSLTEAVAKVQAALDKLAAAADAAKSTVEAVNATIDAIVEIVKALEIDEETLCAVIAKAKACLKDLIDELLAAAKEAVVEYGPEAVEYIYNYLLNNPEEVIAFVSEYGPAAVELLKEHAEELLAVLGYLAYTYGEDLADYIVENREDVLATLCELVEEYGDEAWALIDVYAEALGITAAIQEKLDCIENSIQEQLAELNSKLEALEKELAEKKAQLENALNELKDELAELKAQLENASGELKEEIEAAIAEIESTIETLENAIAEIEAKIAEIQNAIEELKEELAAIVEESKALYAATSELVDAIEEMIAIASGELEGDLTEAIAKVQAALVKVGEAIEAAETLTNALGEIIDGAVTLTKELLEASDELQAAVDKAIADAENAVNELVEELESILAELPEELREEIQTVIDEIQTAVKETVAELATAAKELASEVLGDLAEDVEAALVPVVDYVTTEGQKLVDELLAVLKEMYIDATTDEYTVTDDSYYVALGDGTAVSESYVDRLAEALGVDYNNLAQEGLLMENIQQILMENAAEILKADLITVGYGNNAFTNYTVEQLMNQIDGVEATFDWSLYVGEDGVPYVKDALADVHAHFVESGMNGDYMGANVADLLTLAVESYAYSYMAYVCSYPEAINAIREMNPEALIIIVGMYNPLDNVVVDFDGTPFAIGEYVQYLIDVTNLHTTAYAMLTSNAIYVDAPDVETINTRTEMTAMQFIVEYMYRRGVNMNPSENGHEYIKDQILNALTITVEEKGLLGDADSNGVVNSVDAALILQYDALIVDENGLDLSVCDVNGDGVVNSVDSAYILQYDALLITEFPASK